MTCNYRLLTIGQFVTAFTIQQGVNYVWYYNMTRRMEEKLKEHYSE